MHSRGTLRTWTEFLVHPRQSAKSAVHGPKNMDTCPKFMGSPTSCISTSRLTCRAPPTCAIAPGEIERCPYATMRRCEYEHLGLGDSFNSYDHNPLSGMTSLGSSVIQEAFLVCRGDCCLSGSSRANRSRLEYSDLSPPPNGETSRLLCVRGNATLDLVGIKLKAKQ